MQSRVSLQSEIQLLFNFLERKMVTLKKHKRDARTNGPLLYPVKDWYFCRFLFSGKFKIISTRLNEKKGSISS